MAVNNATADVGIFLMIGALRHAYIPIAAIREGEFGLVLDTRRALSDMYCIGKWQGQTSLGHDPQAKTLGILGMGGIGRVG